MENKEIINPQDIQIQGLIDRYLRSTVSINNAVSQGNHLNEDALAAFTEGTLNSRESQPIVRHLVDCSFCRHITVELIRLDLAFAVAEVEVPINEKQPSKVSEVLSNLLSRIFGSNDGVVFAHQENEDDENPTESEDVKK